MLDTKERPVEGTVTEPAKRWKVRCVVVAKNRHGAALGTVYDSTHTFPSKEVAEQRFEEHAARQVALHGFHAEEVVCIFPVTP